MPLDFYCKLDSTDRSVYIGSLPEELDSLLQDDFVNSLAMDHREAFVNQVWVTHTAPKASLFKPQALRVHLRVKPRSVPREHLLPGDTVAAKVLLHRTEEGVRVEVLLPWHRAQPLGAGWHSYVWWGGVLLLVSYGSFRLLSSLSPQQAPQRPPRRISRVHHFF